MHKTPGTGGDSDHQVCEIGPGDPHIQLSLRHPRNTSDGLSAFKANDTYQLVSLGWCTLTMNVEITQGKIPANNASRQHNLLSKNELPRQMNLQCNA